MKTELKLLVEEATTIEYGVNNGFDRVTFDEKKFAELILSQVVNILSQQQEKSIEEGWEIDESFSVVRTEIEEYFGVGK